MARIFYIDQNKIRLITDRLRKEDLEHIASYLNESMLLKDLISDITKTKENEDEIFDFNIN